MTRSTATHAESINLAAEIHDETTGLHLARLLFDDGSTVCMGPDIATQRDGDTPPGPTLAERFMGALATDPGQWITGFLREHVTRTTAQGDRLTMNVWTRPPQGATA